MPALLGQNFVIKESLRAYILRERAKKEEEEAQTSAREQQIKEREQKAKLDSLTLEQTREKIVQQEKLLADLEQEKHTLFNQLKKVLNKESEQKRRVQLPAEMPIKIEPPIGLQSPQNIIASAAAAQSAIICGSTQVIRPTPAPTAPPPLVGVKRGRSPSPPSRNVITAGPFGSPSAFPAGGVRIPLDPSKKSPSMSASGQSVSTIFSNFGSPQDIKPPFTQDLRMQHPLTLSKSLQGVAGIPVLPTPRQMGSISSGYAVPKPNGHPAVRPGFPGLNPKFS